MSAVQSWIDKFPLTSDCSILANSVYISTQKFARKSFDSQKNNTGSKDHHANNLKWDTNFKSKVDINNLEVFYFDVAELEMLRNCSLLIDTAMIFALCVILMGVSRWLSPNGNPELHLWRRQEICLLSFGDICRSLII